MSLDLVGFSMEKIIDDYTSISLMPIGSIANATVTWQKSCLILAFRYLLTEYCCTPSNMNGYRNLLWGRQSVLTDADEGAESPGDLLY